MVNYNFSVTKNVEMFCKANKWQGEIFWIRDLSKRWFWESHLGYFCPKHWEVSDLKIEKQHCLLQAPQLTFFVLLWPFMGTHNTAESLNTHLECITPVLAMQKLFMLRVSMV